MFTRRLILGLLGAFALSACTHVPIQSDPTVVTTVYLVRHAEKLGGEDPNLTLAGEERAAALGKWIKAEGAKPVLVHSSQYKRTLNTALLAMQASGLKTVERLGNNIRIYNPRDLSAIAKHLKQTPGRHLVVGHSNTTPQLVALLGGSAGNEINEASEYDRLYIVQFFKDGTVASALKRYGARYVPAA
jgi:phosphohistidine phosphatase SixA